MANPLETVHVGAVVCVSGMPERHGTVVNVQNGHVRIDFGGKVTWLQLKEISLVEPAGKSTSTNRMV